ncbi:MAG: hypothetical protein AAGC46_04975 [Solirubrobacteraceae bacterium]|nr:hypothetical protein [Patulibacter sp.]
MSASPNTAALDAKAHADAVAVTNIQGKIHALGSRPPGDPEDLYALSRKLGRLATRATSAGNGVPAAMGRATFEGPAGDRFRLNASHASGAGAKAHEVLEDASKSALKDGHDLATKQATYDKSLSALSAALTSAKATAAASQAASSTPLFVSAF